MKLEEQVCSLELARKLKELGVRQESVFHWAVATDGRMFLYFSRFDEAQGRNPVHGNNDIAAFTVAELGELLPKLIMGRTDWESWANRKFTLEIDYSKNKWNIYYIAKNCDKDWLGGSVDSTVIYPEGDKNGINLFKSKASEADARAAMLVHLIKKGIVKL